MARTAINTNNPRSIADFGVPDQLEVGPERRATGYATADVFERGGPRVMNAGLFPPTEREVRQKLTRLLGRFGDDPRKAFDHYDRNRDGKLDAREIQTAVRDAGIGWPETVSSKILERFDRDKNGGLDFEEFRSLGR